MPFINTMIIAFMLIIQSLPLNAQVLEITNAVKTLNYKPSQKAMDNISNYVSGGSSDNIKKGLKILLEPELDEKLIKAKKDIGPIKIDGEPSDWTATDFITENNENNVKPVNTSSPSGNYAPSDHIKRYGFVMDDDYLYCLFEPEGLPEKGQQYHYRINFANTKWQKIYAITWTSKGNFIQYWNVSDDSFIKNIPPDYGTLFAGKKVFEAKISRKLLPDLPEFFYIDPVVWHEHKNLYDECALPSVETSITKKYYKSSLEVFCKYAEKIPLIPDDPFPIAQAITEGYIYKMADNTIKEQVISDGLEMIKEAKKSMEYTFPGQEPLSGLCLEAILSWSNRTIIYNGYNSIGFYLTENGTLNKEGYEFMVMTPSTLDKCRSVIKKDNLLNTGNLAKTIEKIETKLWNINKYRRYYFKDIEEIYKYDKNYFQTVYEESLHEKNNNLTNITNINGFDINKGCNFSSTFQVDYIYNNGFFYGNCVDVTAIAMAFYKSIGIPSLHFCYGVISPNHYREIDSYTLYYSSEEDKWFNYLKKEKILCKWATDNVPDYKVYFYINRPQIGSYWKLLKKPVMGNSLWYSPRLYDFIVTEKEWNEINTEGYEMEKIKNIMFIKE